MPPLSRCRSSSVPFPAELQLEVFRHAIDSLERSDDTKARAKLLRATSLVSLGCLVSVLIYTAPSGPDSINVFTPTLPRLQHGA